MAIELAMGHLLGPLPAHLFPRVARQPYGSRPQATPAQQILSH